MEWRLLLFDPDRFCAPVFCRGSEGDAPAAFPPAPLVVVLVSSGRAALAAGAEPVLLAAGELLLAAGTAVEAVPAGPVHLLAAGFRGAAAEAAAASLAAPLVSNCGICPLAAQLLAELAGAAGPGTAQPDAMMPAGAVRHGTAEAGALCYRILCALAGADAAVPRLPPLVADAVLAIRQNYAGLYGVEELSDQLGVSKSHLVRVFSAAMGMGPGQYLTSVRIDAAKSLLARRDYPLEVVATLCGFSGANYLCKVFKKHTGLTPAAFRAQNAEAAHTGALSELEQTLYT